MKDFVTNFDINAAFKALDEIDYPEAGKMRANRAPLSEALVKGPQTDCLLEDYFDVSNNAELEDAKEVIKADSAEEKLKRVQEIIDPEAEVPEDLVKSYNGKGAILCPQCRNIFYKDAADIIPQEGQDSVHVGDTVNVGEECIQCHNSDGFKLIGYISEKEIPVEEEKSEVEDVEEEIPAEEENKEEEKQKENKEEAPEETDELEEVELEEIPEEAIEEPKEELKEALNQEDDISDKEYLQAAKSYANRIFGYGKGNLLGLERVIDSWHDFNFAEKAPEDEAEQIIYDAMINRFKQENVLEEVTGIKEINEALSAEEQERFDEISKDGIIHAKDRYEFQDLLKKSKEPEEDNLTEADIVNKITNDKEAEDYLKKELATPISEEEVNSMLGEKLKCKNTVKNSGALDNLEDFKEELFDKQITEYLSKVYKNVDSFKTTGCKTTDNTLIVEGKLNFKSGKTKNTKFSFTAPLVEKLSGCITLTGCNTDLAKDNAFTLNCTLQDSGKSLFVESLSYSYKIGEKLVEGLIH